MRKVERKIILRDERGWMIVYGSGFPSCNYSVFKTDKWKPNDKLPQSGVAYCGSLGSALNQLFKQLVIEKVNDKSYCASIKDLSKVLEETRQDLNDLLKIQRSQQSTTHKPLEKENKGSRLQTTLDKLERR